MEAVWSEVQNNPLSPCKEKANLRHEMLSQNQNKKHKEWFCVCLIYFGYDCFSASDSYFGNQDVL